MILTVLPRAYSSGRQSASVTQILQSVSTSLVAGLISQLSLILAHILLLFLNEGFEFSYTCLIEFESCVRCPVSCGLTVVCGALQRWPLHIFLCSVGDTEIHRGKEAKRTFLYYIYPRYNGWFLFLYFLSFHPSLFLVYVLAH